MAEEKSKNKLSKFVGSYKGRTLFNRFYGFGASVAILGTLFKLLHLDGANIMLAIGLGTEAFIFAISAFEPPYRLYKWERVFKILKSGKEKDKPDFSKSGVANIAGNDIYSTANRPENQRTGGFANHPNPVENITNAQAAHSFGIPPQVQLNDEDARTLSESIKRMGEAVSQLNNMADITQTTQKYLEQLSTMTDNLNKFSNSTSSLAEVSNILLNSYKNVTENSDDISENSKGYVEQMAVLNKNLTGLNTIYEIQLKSISSQIDTIDRVNKGILHIRDMYEGSMEDSNKFREETEEMAKNLTKLNTVYSRMLEAMTPNIGFPGHTGK